MITSMSILYSSRKPDCLQMRCSISPLAGYDAGSWNLDKIGDAVKELNIRLVDGSDTTKAGLEAIGMNADEVAKKCQKAVKLLRRHISK